MGLVVKAALADQIVGILRDRIISGLLSTETPIRQDALAAELGVSKIPLREAFAKLEQDGLVVSHLNRGFFVRRLSAEEAYDVFDLRLKIEPDAVAAAAARATPDDRKIARLALETLNASTMAHGADVGSLNRAFHMALVRPCGRPVTLQMAERLQIIAERYVVKHLEPMGRSDRALSEHAALFDFWASGDAGKAAAMSAAHIASTLHDLKIELRKAAELLAS